MEELLDIGYVTSFPLAFVALIARWLCVDHNIGNLSRSKVHDDAISVLLNVKPILLDNTERCSKKAAMLHN